MGQVTLAFSVLGNVGCSHGLPEIRGAWNLPWPTGEEGQLRMSLRGRCPCRWGAEPWCRGRWGCHHRHTADEGLQQQVLISQWSGGREAQDWGAGMAEAAENSLPQLLPWSRKRELGSLHASQGHRSQRCFTPGPHPNLTASQWASQRG